MKKLFALLLACLLLLTACGQTPVETTGATEPADTTAATEATKPQVAVFYPRWPEETEEEAEQKDFSDVDETKPNANGVYELHSAQGLKMLSEHPDGKFKLLWNIDLQGAEWTPIAEFTGEIEGQNYAISNFTVAADSQGNTGFIAVNKGVIKNVKLENVTVTANTGVVGGFVACNEGELSGCIVTGTMRLEGDALAGGLAGKANGGSMFLCECGMEIRAAETVTLGLLCGEAKNTQVKNCYYNGPMNTKGEALYTQLSGSRDNAEFKDCLWRDNTYSDQFLTEESVALRTKAQAITYKMGTVEWTVPTVINYIHPTGGTSLGRIFIPGTVYTGIPYTANFGDLSRFMYCFAEDGNLKDFATEITAGYDGMDKYMGCDCSGGVYWGWAAVSPTTQWWVTNQMFPSLNLGAQPIGEYEGAWTLQDTMQITKANDEQTLAEAYAQLHMSDAIMTFYNNPDNANDHFNHTRMVVQCPVVMRKSDGTIDMGNSYVITHEQGKSNKNSSWLMYGKYTFQELWNTHYIPLTCQEFIDGAAPELVVTIDNANTGKAYMTTGVIKSNYRLISTNVTITDEVGKAVFDRTLFVNVRKFSDVGTHEPSRYHITEQDMVAYAAFLGEAELVAGKTYTYTVTANTAAGDVQVKTFDFVQ